MSEENAEILIVTPPVTDEEDPLEFGLVALTEAISQIDRERVAAGFLGGEFGYGAEWDSSVFMMHPFCWCDRPDCPWCGGCDCPEGSTHFLVDGIDVGFKAWMEFFERETSGARGPGEDGSEWTLRADAANARREERHDAICDYCRGVGKWTENGAVAGRGAPNFWHKPSGLKVWWYKWIGRDMVVHAVEGINLTAIFAECAASLAAAPSQDGPST